MNTIKSVQSTINIANNWNSSNWFPEVFDFQTAHAITAELFKRPAEALLLLIQNGYVGIY